MMDFILHGKSLSRYDTLEFTIKENVFMWLQKDDTEKILDEPVGEASKHSHIKQSQWYYLALILDRSMFIIYVFVFIAMVIYFLK